MHCPRDPSAPTVCGSPQTPVAPGPGTGEVTGEGWHQTESSREPCHGVKQDAGWGLTCPQN